MSWSLWDLEFLEQILESYKAFYYSFSYDIPQGLETLWEAGVWHISIYHLLGELLGIRGGQLGGTRYGSTHKK